MENMVIFKRNKGLMNLNDTELDSVLDSTSLLKLYLLDNMTLIEKEKIEKALDNLDNLLLDCIVEKYLKTLYECKDTEKIKTMEYYPLSKERMDIFADLIKELK